MREIIAREIAWKFEFAHHTRALASSRLTHLSHAATRCSDKM